MSTVHVDAMCCRSFLLYFLYSRHGHGFGSPMGRVELGWVQNSQSRMGCVGSDWSHIRLFILFGAGWQLHGIKLLQNNMLRLSVSDAFMVKVRVVQIH